jgi:hypothetical protein
MKRAAPCACARPCPRAPLPYRVRTLINAHKHPGPGLFLPSRIPSHRTTRCTAGMLSSCCMHPLHTSCLYLPPVRHPSYATSICITATSHLLGVSRIHSSLQPPLACLATSRCLPTPNLCFFFLCTQAIATTSVISCPPMPNIYNKEGPIGYETTSPIQSFARDHNHATAPSTTPHDPQPPSSTTLKDCLPTTRRRCCSLLPEPAHPPYACRQRPCALQCSYPARRQVTTHRRPSPTASKDHQPSSHARAPAPWLHWPPARALPQTARRCHQKTPSAK